MNWIEMIGYVAAFCTTISFVPQAIQIIRTKNTEGISLRMYAVFTFGTAAWLTFGWLQGNLPIIVANAITLLLACLILFLKIKYK
ncbi:MAG: SemiSWEET transporter [Bacteroidota bacterium]|nr:SemiSWEET transporter [Bacteroidota bacterium]